MPIDTIDPKWLVGFIRETSSALWTVGSDGYVLNVPEWIALTGQTAREAEGEGWADAIHPEDAPRARAAWQTAVIHRSHYNTDYRLRCADGSYRWFNARALPILDAQGMVTKWFGVMLAIPGLGRFGRSDADERSASADQFDDITPQALRAARALLNWPAERLASEAGVSRSTVRRLEDDNLQIATRRTSIQQILDVLVRERVRCFARDRTIVGVGLDHR